MTIHIEELSFDAIIGILDFERNTPQKVIINCRIDYDNQEGFLDYVHIVNLITKMMQQEQFELLESAILAIFSEIRKLYPQVLKIFLKITKPDIIDNCKVSVSKKVTFL